MDIQKQLTPSPFAAAPPTHNARALAISQGCAYRRTQQHCCRMRPLHPEAASSPASQPTPAALTRMIRCFSTMLPDGVHPLQKQFTDCPTHQLCRLPRWPPQSPIGWGRPDPLPDQAQPAALPSLQPPWAHVRQKRYWQSGPRDRAHVSSAHCSCSSLPPHLRCRWQGDHWP